MEIEQWVYHDIFDTVLNSRNLSWCYLFAARTIVDNHSKKIYCKLPKFEH